MSSSISPRRRRACSSSTRPASSRRAKRASVLAASTRGPRARRSTARSGCFWPTPPKREQRSWTAPSTYRGRGRATSYDAQGGVPAGLVFRNKIELAEEMLQRALAADVPARWVLADSFYGRSHAFRVWLEERGRPYAV